ncbi:hypothetical protein [Pseudaminobacter salicylatoxidans]|nr:hypothetical protein [Pseudaminobacter salicylatoxidans]
MSLVNLHKKKRRFIPAIAGTSGPAAGQFRTCVTDHCQPEIEKIEI